jgi:hypothetical protein
VRQLEPVMVAAGQALITFDIVPPPGYKLNPSAPITLREVGADDVQNFSPGEMPGLAISAITDRDLLLDLTLYYCEAEDERLCLIHDERLLIPLRIVEGIPPEISIRYEIDPKI